MEKYNLEKAREEAEILREKVESGSAKNYAEANEQIDRERHQEMIWHCPTDDEVRRLSREVDVNIRANTEYSTWQNFKGHEELIKRSGSNRLIDLGSAYTLLDCEFPEEIRNYIAVDLGIKNEEFRRGDLSIKCLQREILDALHSFPDNYANAWMIGIESGNVLRNYDEWSFAVLAELKRVVPENGFIFTDSGFVHETLIRCITELEELFNILLSIKHLEEERMWGNLSGLSEAEKKQAIKKIEEQVKKYECQKNDPYAFLGKRYIINAPQIGFRIYLNKFWPWSENMIIINTKQKRDTCESKPKDSQ